MFNASPRISRCTSGNPTVHHLELGSKNIEFNQPMEFNFCCVLFNTSERRFNLYYAVSFNFWLTLLQHYLLCDVLQ